MVCVCVASVAVNSAGTSATRFSVTDDSFGTGDVARLKVLHDGQTGAMASVSLPLVTSSRGALLPVCPRAQKIRIYYILLNVYCIYLS